MAVTAFSDWTARAVRLRINEAVETARTLPRASVKQFGQAWPDYVGLYPCDMRPKLIPTAGALSRMEETFGWVNSWLNESQRKIVYEYSETRTRRGRTIQRLCEKNEWIRRTFERAVADACQAIASRLNRNQEVRLLSEVDAVSQITAKSTPFEVVSDNRAPVRRKDYHRADDAKPAHTPGSEAEIIKHIEKVNHDRRQDAERARKAALRKAEEAARLAEKCRQREQQRRKQQVAA